MDLTSVEAVCDLLARGGLLPPDQARELGERWARDGGAATDGLGFIRWLVVHRHLTV